MYTATYFDDQKLLLVRCSEHVHFASLMARIAEWTMAIGAPKGRVVLVDLRRLCTIDRPFDAPGEYVNLQQKMAQDGGAASKMALLATRPEIFVLARIFEQYAQDHVPTDIDVFRNGSDALAFLGVSGGDVGDVDDAVGSLRNGRVLD